MTYLGYLLRSLRRFSRGLVFVSLALALGCGLTELLVRLSDLAPRQRAAADEPAAEGEEADPPLSNRVLHPYLGYEQRPGTVAAHFDLENHASLHEDEFVIGVVGGSVATGVARIGGESLAAGLRCRRRPDLGSGGRADGCRSSPPPVGADPATPARSPRLAAPLRSLRRRSSGSPSSGPASAAPTPAVASRGGRCW